MVTILAAPILGLQCHPGEESRTGQSHIDSDREPERVLEMKATAQNKSGFVMAPANDQLVFPASQIEPKKVYQRKTSDPIQNTDAMIVDENIADQLMQSLPIPSKSCEEAPFAGHAKDVLTKLGMQVRIDDTAQKVKDEVAKNPQAKQKYYCNSGQTAPTTGNLIGFLPATDASLPSWNLSFHLDTNQVHFEGITRKGDTIYPGAGSPLGADDKSGFAIITEVIRAILDNQIPHGDIRVVGLFAEEQGGAGAKLIDSEAFLGDVLVSVDGTADKEIGRAAPFMYSGYITVKTETSHPAEMFKKNALSACAVGAKILTEADFNPTGQPSDGSQTVWLVYHTSCGIDEGAETSWGNPKATEKYNTVPPYWTASWQMRDLEGLEHATTMVQGLRKTVERVCRETSVGKTEVSCEVTGTEDFRLEGYKIEEDFPTLQILERGFEKSKAGKQKVTATQFGGFNGNHIYSRFGEQMVLVDTGASQIHTNEETVSISHAADVARGLLASMVESYHYSRTPQ